MIVNKAILVGHLGADPDIKANAQGAKIARFSLATSERWRDKATGERKERTTWHNIVIFNEQLVGIAEQYLKKGAKVYVEGAIEKRKWTGQDNVERTECEIVLRNFQSKIVMLDRASRAPDPTEDSYGSSSNSASSGSGAASRRDDMDDEIPF